MRENVGRNIRPIGVTFAHPRNSNLPEFERFFVCLVEYGSASDQWSLSNETLTVPYLLETLQPFCDQAAKERNTAVLGPAVFSRERIAEVAAARQGQQTNRGEGAGDERADAVSQTGRRENNLRGTWRSVAAKSRAPIHQGSEYIGVTNCVVAGQRRIDLV